MPPRGNPARRFVVTLANYTDDEHNHFNAYAKDNCLYAIVAKEIGPESGTPHLQCFFHLSKKIRIGTLANLLVGSTTDTRFTAALARGSDEDNRNYCSKDGSFTEHGVVQVNGKSNELQQAIETLRQGTMEDVIEHHPACFVRHHRGLRALADAKFKPREKKPLVIWLYGAPGVGKSRLSIEIASKMSWTVYRKSFNTKLWFDGYQQQQLLLLDDIRCTMEGVGKTFMYLLEWLDRYPCRVENKGGSIFMNSPVIFITCLQDHKTEYLGENEHIGQLTRRIDHELEVKPDEYDDLVQSILNEFMLLEIN